MAVYRRFVAYVYEYRKGKKEKNCGFIRVEVWERRCRLEVHLQCPGLTPDVACMVYGFVRNGGLMDGCLLGAGRTEAGRFECTLETDAMNMGQHGIALKRMGGMILKTENGAFFGTEWDDQPVRPENFREIQKRPEPTVRKERQELRPEEPAPGKVIQQAPGESVPEPENAQREPRESEPEPENAQQEPGESESEPENAQPEPGKSELEPEKMQPEPGESEPEPEKAQQESGESEPEPGKAQSEQVGSGEANSEEENSVQEGVKPEEANAGLEKTQPDPSGAQSERMRTKTSSESEKPQAAGAGLEAAPSDLESQAVRDAADAPSSRPRRPLPGEEFQPFEDGELEEARKIHPRDLMRFRRQDCIFRNNRFLQYGYYNFGHLLLGRKSDGRYVLGVPGGYDQQERFMANMFGFPYFKESRYVELHGRRGGYWYRLIDAPDFH